MEVVAYLAVTTLWWISSLTVLSPFVLLLLLSKTFRNGWFSFFFGKVMGPLCSHKFMAKRKKLFELLEEHLPNRDKSIPLDILEIGIGPGANLQFYPENSNLTALDMNPSFFQIFHNNRKKYPQVKLVRTVLNWAEDMNEVEDSAYDVVISTHVLCSVKNIESVMKEVKRVLKPGGKFLFLEHVAYPENEGGHLAQRFAAPLWAVYCDGCYPNRNTADAIKNAGFSDVQCDVSYSPSLLLFIRPHIIGVATK
ncbi:thiol S-methyltransferase TMT1B [Parasteatoda tepidariorum]|uniref:Methyltransferase-like protein 7A n=1 Tax=Parasteatoda tepidariorum TaxID=114398 RepID=A0A2L2YE55_PARTP|nr:methyltransferase-like protein 7B [Parasteatoda tepidariorum]